ncbi:hypothetical protein EV356DRAFT_504353 [Viridothelium virens]|uniref:Mitochondrial carrier protein pet8 n=1 Tax=Viridothelium virens TaxID=1048519 RepID=A0A6A6HLY7_VIRVR|nr:hypothetical protein EV356DRAFT_504353 [Viridothelium virens]
MSLTFRSFAFQRSLRLRPALYTPLPSRSYRASATRLAGKESALHNETRAEEAEHHKQDQLRKQKEGKGEWKDELASDSESIVKADRGEIDASEETISKLQKEAEQIGKKTH